MSGRLLLCAASLVLTLTEREAFALAGVLKSPSIAIAVDASGSPKSPGLKKALDVLRDKKYEYVIGSFINSASRLCYAGETDDLNRFLDELAKIDGIQVSVSFSREKGWAESPFDGPKHKKGPCQWEVFHMGQRFQVKAYLGDGKIDIEKLVLPAINGSGQAAKE